MRSTTGTSLRTNLMRRCSTSCLRFADRVYDDAVSFHGTAADDVLIGGLAPDERKEAVCNAIDAVVECPVRLVGPDHRLSGALEVNIVNRYARGGGVQIEQPADVRSGAWEDVVDAVAGVFGD